jgi:hypothetical protein
LPRSARITHLAGCGTSRRTLHIRHALIAGGAYHQISGLRASLVHRMDLCARDTTVDCGDIAHGLSPRDVTASASRGIIVLAHRASRSLFCHAAPRIAYAR